MTSIPRSYKIFYGVICAAALLIGFLGYFAPTRLAEITSWLTLPPLHARFVGALYFYGAVFMAGCMMARQHAEVRYAMPMIAIWTGLLFVISILSLGAFDLTLLPPWIWFASYLIYPLIALWFTWKQRHMDNSLSGEHLPNWAKNFLLVQGIIVGLFSLALVLTPNLMGALWPWKLTPLLAQTYGGPLLASGIGSYMFAQRGTWSAVRTVAPAMFVFTTLVLLASVIHRNLFSMSELNDLIWFIAFGVETVFLGLITVRALRQKN